MEIILAVVVASAVIFFGALISMGNERQKKAIDGLREQVVLWAIRDLHLKYEKMVQEVKLDDPIAWLNQLVERVYGENLDLTATEIFEFPQSLVCTARDGRKVVFSSASPHDIRRLKRERKNRLSKFADANPLLNSLHRQEQIEISILNGGMLFDLELPKAWKLITGLEAKNKEKLWIYL